MPSHQSSCRWNRGHSHRHMGQFYADTTAKDLLLPSNLLGFDCELRWLITAHMTVATYKISGIAPVSYLISSIVNLKMMVQIIPKMSFVLVSTMSDKIQYWDSSIFHFAFASQSSQDRVHTPSAPILVNWRFRSLINSRALLTFSTFWILILGFWLYRPKDVSPMISYYDVRGSASWHFWREKGTGFRTYQELNQSYATGKIFSKVIDMRNSLDVQFVVHPS